MLPGKESPKHGKADRCRRRQAHHPASCPEEAWPAPGDELTLVESDEGLLVYQHGLSPPTARRWSVLSEGERRQAQAEAERYESLCEKGRDRIWDEGAESIEEDAEGDEVRIPTK